MREHEPRRREVHVKWLTTHRKCWVWLTSVVTVRPAGVVSCQA